jgi:hypothetical protein
MTFLLISFFLITGFSELTSERSGKSGNASYIYASILSYFSEFDPEPFLRIFGALPLLF